MGTVDEFDDDLYMQINPDVGLAIRHGRMRSAVDHWVAHGKSEGRRGGIPEPLPERGGSLPLRVLNRRPFGVNLLGFLSAKSGLGQVARGCELALDQAGIRTQCVDIPAWGNSFEKRSLPGKLPFRINLLQHNADMMWHFRYAYGVDLFTGRYNIGFWFWELPSIRSDWFPSYRYFDEIWVASEFCRRAVQCITNLPVRRMPLVVDKLEQRCTHGRSYFQFADDVFVFCCVFDVSSSFERKNPLAVVQAFRRAFGDSRQVLLCLKYSNANYDAQSVEQLSQAVQGASNIVAFDRMFSDEENVSLHSAIDCLVSAHRSEGFGLNLAEAMYFGKPVIGTRYSSNLDFMTDENSYLIDCTLTPIKDNHGPYIAGNVWAEPSVDHLADLLRRVFEDSTDRARKGRIAAADIRSQFSTATAAAAMRERFSALGLDSANCGVALHSHRKGANPGSTAPVKVVDDIRDLNYRPLISVVTPVYNVDALLLRRCIDSVRLQWYPFWELCLCDDGSSSEQTIAALEEYRGFDGRIKVIRSPVNNGIAAASNSAAEISSGAYIAFLDNDDEITPDALYEVAKALNRAPDADLIYSDEDKIEAAGDLSDPYFKPDWSPEHLHSVMYLLHLLVVQKELFYRVGGFRREYSGAQDYDLALRASRQSARVLHIPKILYHWRKIPGSAAAKVDAKPAAIDAARRALEDHIGAIDSSARVEPGKLFGYFHVRYSLARRPLASLCITTNDSWSEINGRGRINLVENLVKSIAAKTDYRNFEIIVCDNRNLSTRTKQALADIPYRLVSYTGPVAPFNFAAKANYVFSQAKGDHVVLLNDDLEVITPEWLTALLELSEQPDIGVVGARLLFPDNRIQHVGIVLGVNQGAAHVYHNYPAEFVGYNGFTHIVRNYSAVTGACMAVRRSVVQELGGFDTRFAIDYNDVDFCLRAIEKGYRVVYTPYAELFHFEGRTAERRAACPKTLRLFNEQWAKYVQRDPYYNPNLTRTGVDFARAETESIAGLD